MPDLQIAEVLGSGNLDRKGRLVFDACRFIAAGREVPLMRGLFAVCKAG